MSIEQADWKDAAINANNLSELHLTIGDIAQAITAGQHSVDLADQGKDAFWRISCRTALADARQQAGEPEAARTLFAQAEQLQQERQPEHDRLYGLAGFRYCDLLLAKGAWPEVREQAKNTLLWAKQDCILLSIALDKLSLGRAALQEAIEQSRLLAVPSLIPDLICLLSPNNAPAPDSRSIETMNQAKDWLDQAVAGLREAGEEEFITRGLLARAAWHRWAAVLLVQTELTLALVDLQEATEIAERSGMRLHLIDCHLEAARLALTSVKDVLAHTVAEHLAAAQDGIKETGYNRRLPEVANIEELLVKL